ncbi:MAG: acyltransferase, partial [Pseudomonadota bacterium]
MTTQAARPVAETATEDAAKRLIWLDSLRLVAGVSMVGLHATADAQGQPFAAYEPAERIFPMLLRAVIYTARTELFLIISIFLLLMAFERRPKSYGTVVSIQARRLLIPFVFWTVFFAFYGLIKADAFGYLDYAAERLTNPLEWFGFFILGDVKYHMHFIPTLFVLVLMFPLFHLAVSYPWLGILILAALLLKRDLDAFIYATFWGTEGLPYLVRAVKVATYAGYGLLAGAFLGIWQQVDWQVRASFLPLVLGLGGLLFALKLVATWKT